MSLKAAPGGFPERRVNQVPAVTAAQMREVQRAAQEDIGLDILMLVENGGRAVATLALAMLGGRGRGQRVVVAAGGGNKGATGLCAARHLANWGVEIDHVFGEVESEMSFAAQREIQILRASGIFGPAEKDITEVSVESRLARADLIIDALVGYGLDGPPMGIAAAVTNLAMASRRPVLAVDVPTGVNASTGTASSPCIQAATTLLLDLPKRGLIDGQCRGLVGELYLADLGVPRTVYERFGINVNGLFAEGPIVRLRR